MVFTTLSLAGGLSPAAHERALTLGPTFVEAPADYSSLLGRAGWDVTEYVDVTEEYAHTARLDLRAYEVRADGLEALLGTRDFAERMSWRRGYIQAIEEGLLRRELFCAHAR